MNEVGAHSGRIIERVNTFICHFQRHLLKRKNCGERTVVKGHNLKSFYRQPGGGL